MKKLNIISVLLAAVFLGIGGAYIFFTQVHADTLGPVITMEQDHITCSISASEDELKAGITVADSKDGDLTDQLMINDIRITEPGSKDFTISYIVFDSDNHVTVAERGLTYSDYVSPQFRVKENLRTNVMDDVDFYNSISVEDCLDGDLSGFLEIEVDPDYLDTYAVGEYTLTASVKNSLGDVSQQVFPFTAFDSGRDVDVDRPEVHLNTYCIYLKVGQTINPMDYIKSVTIKRTDYAVKDGATINLGEEARAVECGYYNEEYGYFILQDMVDISSDFKSQEEGTYTVRYEVTNPKDNSRGYALLTIVVEE